MRELSATIAQPHHSNLLPRIVGIVTGAIVAIACLHGGAVAAQEGFPVSEHPLPEAGRMQPHDAAPEAGMMLLRARSDRDPESLRLFDYRRGEVVAQGFPVMDFRAAFAFSGRDVPQIVSGMGADFPGCISPDARYLAALWSEPRGAVLRIFDMEAGGQEIAQTAPQSRLPQRVLFEQSEADEVTFLVADTDGINRITLRRGETGQPWQIATRPLLSFPGDGGFVIGSLRSTPQGDGRALSLISYRRDSFSGDLVSRAGLMRAGEQQMRFLSVPGEVLLRDLVYLPHLDTMVMAGDGMMGVALLDEHAGARDPDRRVEWARTDTREPQLHYLPGRDLVLQSDARRIIAFRGEALLDWLDDPRSAPETAPMGRLVDRWDPANFATLVAGGLDVGEALLGLHVLDKTQGAERLLVLPITSRNRPSDSRRVMEIDLAAMLEAAGLGLHAPAPLPSDARFQRLDFEQAAILPLPAGTSPDNHATSIDGRFYSFDILAPDGTLQATRVVDAHSLDWWDSEHPLSAATGYVPGDEAFFFLRPAEERRLFRRQAGVEIVLLDAQTGAQRQRAFFACSDIYLEDSEPPYRCGDFEFPDHVRMRYDHGRAAIDAQARFYARGQEASPPGRDNRHIMRELYIHPRTLALMPRAGLAAPDIELPNVLSLVQITGDPGEAGGVLTIRDLEGRFGAARVTLPREVPRLGYGASGFGDFPAHQEGIALLRPRGAGDDTAAILVDLESGASCELRDASGAPIQARELLSRSGDTLLADVRGGVLVYDLARREVRHQIETGLGPYRAGQLLEGHGLWIAAAASGSGRLDRLVVLDYVAGRADISEIRPFGMQSGQPPDLLSGLVADMQAPGLRAIGADAPVIPSGPGFGVQDARLDGTFGIDPFNGTILRLVPSGDGVEVLRPVTRPLDIGMRTCGRWELSGGQGVIGAFDAPISLRHGPEGGGALVPIITAAPPRFTFRSNLLVVEMEEYQRLRLRRVSAEECHAR
ncbi:MAG: hypothetical protein JJU40_03265 [Rhodobacteraceae bacterium]|nr:hypothetical protein [Paracoccaceae bacterium]